MEAELWHPATAPAPYVYSTARGVRLAFGKQKLMEQDGANSLLQVPQNFASDARDSVQFSHFREIAWTTEGSSVEFNLLRRAAEGSWRNRGAFPDDFAAA